MEPAEFLVPLIPIVAIVAFAAVKIARLRATRPESPSADATARLEALERDIQGLQRELAETQERLDFAERLLSKAREERRWTSSPRFGTRSPACSGASTLVEPGWRAGQGRRPTRRVPWGARWAW